MVPQIAAAVSGGKHADRPYHWYAAVENDRHSPSCPGAKEIFLRIRRRRHLQPDRRWRTRTPDLSSRSPPNTPNHQVMQRSMRTGFSISTYRRQLISSATRFGAIDPALPSKDPSSRRKQSRPGTMSGDRGCRGSTSDRPPFQSPASTMVTSTNTGRRQTRRLDRPDTDSSTSGQECVSCRSRRRPARRLALTPASDVALT